MESTNKQTDKMSLRMQVEKKKAHEEMRRLMAERKKQDSKPMLVDNPLAKYKSGQLTCVLCSSIVKSEKVWQVHINSRQHRENIEQAKKLKELTNNFTLHKIKQKRSGAVHNDGPEEKKIKGILKNTNLQNSLGPPQNNLPNVVSHHNEEVIRTPYNPTLKSDDLLNQPNSTKDVVDPSVAPDQPIPEGFFDDPILDAKVRNIEYKDPVEEEWEKFQKEIKEEASASAEIIAGEQEEATAERQIDEIDEQLRNWSRVLDLELKKEDTKKKMQDLDQMSGSEDDDTDHDASIDEFLDWRAKNSYA